MLAWCYLSTFQPVFTYCSTGFMEMAQNDDEDNFKSVTEEFRLGYLDYSVAPARMRISCP